MWSYKRPLYIHSYYQFNMSTRIPPMYDYIYTCIPPPPPDFTSIYPISLTLHTLTWYVHLLLIYHITLPPPPPPMWPSTHCLFQPVFPGPTPLATTTPLLPSPCSHDPSILWCLSVTTSNPYYLIPHLFFSLYQFPPTTTTIYQKYWC